nr:short-chain dehydrogenase/reductase family 16C member 6-like [Meriones unguiculatus]
MNAVADTAIFFGKFLYYFLESLVFKIIPKGKKNVSGETVLITGAGSGLGRLLAIHFASHGANLVLWDINQEGNLETCRLAKEKGDVKVYAYKCDCSDRREVYRVADKVREEVGDVTILINNAGIVTGKPFLEIPDHMVEKSFLVNVMSHFWTKRRKSEQLKSSASYRQNAKTLDKHPGPPPRDCHLTKYPLLLPLLEQEYAAKKVFNAILEEQVYLLIPKFSYVALILKQIISPKMMIALGEYLGMDSCMTSFTGRAKAKELHPEAERKEQ